MAYSTNKWFIIINPKAGYGKCEENWLKVQERLNQQGITYSYVFTSHQRHATTLTINAIDNEEFRYIMVLGGNGTTNEVLNGIMKQQACPPEDVTLLPIPMGAHNNWMLKYNKVSFEKWLNAINTGKIVMQDIGLVHYQIENLDFQHYFGNNAGTLFSAYLAKESSDIEGGVLNTLVFLRLIIKGFLSFDSLKTRLYFNDKDYHDNYAIMHFNLGPFIAGFNIAPNSNTNDGTFVFSHDTGNLTNRQRITLFKDCATNRYHRSKYLLQEKAKVVYVQPLENALGCQIEVDGEELGHAPAKFEVVEKKLRLLIPA